MTEEQWREHLDAQASGTEQGPQNKETDSRTQSQKDREQEGQEIRTRLQQRWHDQKQRTAETEQTKGGAEGGGQHPPTQITKNRKIPRQNRRPKVQPEEKSAENYRTWTLITPEERRK